MKEQTLELLRPFGQEHLLRFWDDLSESERLQLHTQIQDIDFALIRELFTNRDHSFDLSPFAERAKDPPAYKFGVLSEGNPSYSAPKKISKAEAITAGKQALSEGKYAVLVVAGGQGTRLGFDKPKGMYPIGPVEETTLFEIHFEKTLATSRKYARNVPMIVMTSPATDLQTREFLQEKDWFGLAAEDRLLFCQGTMPAVSKEDGKVLLDSKSSLALSPDGHGGMLAGINRPLESLDGKSVSAVLKARGVEHIFYFQVDNPLVDICAPEFLGYHLLSGSEMTSQVIRKNHPNDRVGNVVELDGKLHVIEYSDIPESLAARRNPDGSLAIWAGSIAVHQFRLDFLDRLAPNAAALPFHIARKKVSFVDVENGNDTFGQRIAPSEPNAIKFERFIFDLMPSAKNSIVVEVDIPHNYAPIKNAPGSESDCPETVRAQLLALYREFLEKAQVKLAPDVPVEISPLFARSPEDVAEKIPAGTVIDKPTVLR